MNILVTGGTGQVGSEVVKELRKRGATVRVLVRKKAQPAKFPDGVEVAVGDLLDPVSVQKALDGMDKLYLLNGVSADELTQGLIAYDLAKKLKVGQVVYHSVFPRLLQNGEQLENSRQPNNDKSSFIHHVASG